MEVGDIRKLRPRLHQRMTCRRCNLHQARMLTDGQIEDWEGGRVLDTLARRGTARRTPEGGGTFDDNTIVAGAAKRLLVS